MAHYRGVEISLTDGVSSSTESRLGEIQMQRRRLVLDQQLPGESKAERLAQYIIRNPFAVEKMQVSERRFGFSHYRLRVLTDFSHGRP